MAYNPPIITAAGLFVPSYQDIIQDMVTQFTKIYGQGVYLAPDSAQYQELSIYAAKAADTMNLLQLVYNNRGPNYAVGAALDSIVKINGLVRKPATNSTALLNIMGTPGTVITNGQAQDLNAYYWDLPASVTIPVGGSISVTGVCETHGAIVAAAHTITRITTPTAGWTSVDNPSAATIGLPIETDSQLRARQGISAMLPSITEYQGTVSAIAAAPGVTRYNVVENPTNVNDVWGNPSHSITAVVEGGADADVANAIYYNRGLGCYTNGTTLVNVTDPNSNVITPIRFIRPVPINFTITITVKPLKNFTSAISTSIQNYVLAMVKSLQIGQTLSLSSIIAAASQVNIDPTNPVVSILGVTLQPSVATIVPPPTLNAAGTGYAVNDALMISQTGAARGAAIQVVTLGAGGSIATFSFYANGTNYVNATSVPLVGGHGTGATVNITTAANQVLTTDCALYMTQVSQTTLTNIVIALYNALPA